MEENTSMALYLLTERISAQVEAHEKYSAAFIRILDTLDLIKERGAVSREEAHEVHSALTHVATDLRSCGENTKSAIELLSRTAGSSHELTASVGRELHEQRVLIEAMLPHLEEMIRSLKNHDAPVSPALNAISTQHGELLDKVVMVERQLVTNHALITAMAAQLEAIHSAKAGWQTVWEKSRIAFYVAGAIIGVVEVLVQLSVLKLTWLSGH